MELLFISIFRISFSVFLARGIFFVFSFFFPTPQPRPVLYVVEAPYACLGRDNSVSPANSFDVFLFKWPPVFEKFLASM